MLDLWYKNTIFYCLDVETFFDANDDGIGDFEGLTQRLDYIEGLGVTCIWLLPFYPTPNRDNGYDVIDYYNVDPRLGSLGDFVEFTRQARERGMRIIIDLVVNHTSRDHPWFQEARRNKDSRYRNFYVWSEEEPKDAAQGVIFPGQQQRIWTYDEEAGAYYLHRFFAHQPDLNIANVHVRAEIQKIMGFWLRLGVSGFRIDAAPFLIELMGIDDPEVSEPYVYLEELRRFLSWRQGDAILLAEADVDPEQVSEYFGNGNRMHMLFNFIANQHLFVGLATERAEAIVQGLKAMPQPPLTGQWAQFVRNHDELTLERLTGEQQQQIIAAMNVTEEMWLYERGPRRRLPPMLNGDRARIKLTYSLLFALPGTPVLRYGEEIGMGDDLSLPERNSVRTPMQWSNEEHAGFSRAPAEKHVRPVIRGGPFGYEHVNVAHQQLDADSLLNWVERLIRVRKTCPEIGWGHWYAIDTGTPSVLCLRYEWRGGQVLIFHNLSGTGAQIKLDHDDGTGELHELLSDQAYSDLEDSDGAIELGAYGSRWFRIHSEHRRYIYGSTS